jgi:purine-binding chemotaxis protein CheW
MLLRLGEVRRRGTGRPSKEIGSLLAGSERRAALVVAAGSRACAVPLAHVIETMRPLPIEAVPGMPSFVRGLAIIRGAAVPVVDLADATGAAETRAPTRFVLLRLGSRRAALAVSAVVGVRDLDVASLEQMPPLLRGTGANLVEAIGLLDAELLVVLHASRLLPEETWDRLDAREASR